MAIQDIFRALEEQAEEECQALLSHARAQAERVVEQARAESETIKTERLAKVERELTILKSQRVNTARLDSKKKASAEREKLVLETFAQAEEQLAKARSSKDYPAVFERLLAEALDVVGDREAIVHVDPRDADLAKAVCVKMGSPCGVATDLDTAGGAKVSMEDGTVVRLNTLEARLTKARRVMKSDVAAQLFGG
jgi:V/A-type H+-transporting ATPase subunit E